MSYSVELSPNFKKEAKRLSKKHPSLKSDLASLFAELEENPTKDTSLGNNVYKIRLAISSKGKGKSGGARVIIFFKSSENLVILLSIYNKGDQDTISDEFINDLLEEYI